MKIAMTLTAAILLAVLAATVATSWFSTDNGEGPWTTPQVEGEPAAPVDQPTTDPPAD